MAHFPQSFILLLDSAFRPTRIPLGFLATSLDTHPRFTLLILPLHLNLLLLAVPRVMPFWFPFSISTQHLTNLSFIYQLLDVQVTPQYTSAAQKPSAPQLHTHIVSKCLLALPCACQLTPGVSHLRNNASSFPYHQQSSPPVSGSSILPWLKSKTLWSSLTALPYLQSRNTATVENSVEIP